MAAGCAGVGAGVGCGWRLDDACRGLELGLQVLLESEAEGGELIDEAVGEAGDGVAERGVLAVE